MSEHDFRALDQAWGRGEDKRREAKAKRREPLSPEEQAEARADYERDVEIDRELEGR